MTNSVINKFPSRYLDSLQMLTCDDVANVFHVHKDQVNKWREEGILKGIRTGKSFMYSQKEILELQEKFLGYDISNKVKIRESLEQMKYKEILHE